MQKELDVLIVSCRTENRKTMLRACASTIQQAREVLLSHPLALIFCEERLSDGSYRDLLSETHSNPGMNRFVVLLCMGMGGLSRSS